MASDTRTRIHSQLRLGGKTLALTLLGAISALTVPLWQLYFVEVSDIRLELVSIERLQSDGFRVSMDTDELQLLEPYISEHELFEYDHQGKKGDKIHYPDFAIHTLNAAFSKARLDLKNISATKYTLESYIKQIDGYLDAKNTRYVLHEFRLSQLKRWNLASYIDDAEAAYYESQLLELTRNYSLLRFDERGEPQINSAALRFLLSDVREDITDVIVENDSRLAVLRDNLRSIETQLQQMEQRQISQFSYFKVAVVVSNLGRSTMSLRPVAMLRLDIGVDNYVDIALSMDKSQRQAELPPASNKVIVYQSRELHRFPQQDQVLLTTFWGSTGRIKLLTLDTNHNVYSSNQIAFAGNSNQKLVFDRLRQAAMR